MCSFMFLLFIFAQGWNTSEEIHPLFTYSNFDPVSPSPSKSNGVTHNSEIPESTNHTPKTHALRRESLRQGGGVSDLADNSKHFFPQEVSNNGQETAGDWISDLPLTGTNSYSNTHAPPETHSNTTCEPSSAQRSTKIQLTLHSIENPVSPRTDVGELLGLNNGAFMDFLKGTDSPHKQAMTQMHSKVTKSSNPVSILRTFKTAKGEYIWPNYQSHRDIATTMSMVNREEISESKKVIIKQSQTTSWTSNTTPEDNQPPLEANRTERSPRSTNPDESKSYQTVYEDSVLTFSTPATVSMIPDVNQTKPLAISDNDANKYSGFDSFLTEPPINIATDSEETTSSYFKDTQKITGASEVTTQNPHSVPSHITSTQDSSSAPIFDLKSQGFIQTRTYIRFSTTISPALTPTRNPSTADSNESLSPSGRGCLGLVCTSTLESTVQGEQEAHVTSLPSKPQISPGGTYQMVDEHTVLNYERGTDVEAPGTSSSEVSNTNTKPTMQSRLSVYSSTTPNLSSSLKNMLRNMGFSDVSKFNKLSRGHTASGSQIGPAQGSVTSSSVTPQDEIHTRLTENFKGFIAITSSYIPSPSISWTIKKEHPIKTSSFDTRTNPPQNPRRTFGVDLKTVTTPPTNQHNKSTETTSLENHMQPQTSSARLSQPATISPHLIKPKAWTVPPQTVPQTNVIYSTASSSDQKWSHGRHYFIVEDQPVIIKEDTFQVLLQIVLEGDYAPSMMLVEVEAFLRKVSGFQDQHVIWYSGAVLQAIVQFETQKSISWLGRAESLLQDASLNPLPKNGVFVGGIRVKNITLGGLSSNICEWLLECPLGFQCVFLKENATCTSVCRFEYCKHQGICVHRLGHQPVCQCPVGEDFWFMGPRCNVHMTRLHLVGVCLAVLLTMASVMALLSCFIVRRFKNMLMQAKVEQTRSSYRRFNHFDELSARFWGRSWPGSEDSLENRAFTRSDELLHMRALDRTCCYHDDTLSVVSTYHGSGNHLNTVYPHGSQYGWHPSNCSLADGVVDSGKASDLSVCSWPIEPIQWTPFPLLQQLSRNSPAVKASRTRSYCEDMELVGLEKSWTA